MASQEYRLFYGENVEAGLRFLFNAMSAKPEGSTLLQGIPTSLYVDNGTVSEVGGVPARGGKPRY